MDKLDYSKISNIRFGDVDFKDVLDFCDTYICSADYDGVPMSEELLDSLDRDWVYDKLIDYLF